MRNKRIHETFLKLVANMSLQPGCYNVGIVNILTGEFVTETQGEIPDENYRWEDFYQWLIEDMSEVGNIEELTIAYMEYDGKPGEVI